MSQNNSNNSNTALNTIAIGNDFKTNLIEQYAKNAGAGLNVLRSSNIALGTTLDILSGSSLDEATLKATVGTMAGSYALTLFTASITSPFWGSSALIAGGATLAAAGAAYVADTLYTSLKNSYTGSNEYLNTVVYPYTAIKATESYLSILSASNMNGYHAKPSFNITQSVSHIGSALNHVSPLAFDLDGDGIETVHQSQGVFFDIDNDDFSEKVGWIAADDGQLAYDRNGNGTIDNITELFGDYRMSAWDELKAFDTNKDGKVSSADAEFANLRIWKDANQNGISEADELQSLSYHNIKEINLSYTAMDVYQNENFISAKSSVTYTDGHSATNVYDVHFLNDNLNTWYNGAQGEQFGNNFEVKLEALLLPLSRGYGSLPSLHIAMSKDDTLLQMVTDFSTLQQQNYNQIPQKLEEILYRWAGVDTVDPNSVAAADGSNIDARKLRFIEKFTGIEWEQLGFRNAVGHFASLDIKKAWDGIFNELLVRFVTQGTFLNIFPNTQYDFATDGITLNQSYAEIITNIQNSNITEINFLSTISQILYKAKDGLNITTEQINTDLSNISPEYQNLYLSDETIAINGGTQSYYDDFEKGSIAVSDDSSILKRVGDNLDNTIHTSYSGEYVFAKGGNDTIIGNNGEDYIDGGDGNELINGGNGNDWLLGGNGYDTIWGGSGRDKINGGAENDTLNGEQGDDMIDGGSGADILDGGAGIDTLVYFDSTAGVNVNLQTGTATGGDAQGDVIYNFENVRGSHYNDILVGDSSDNFLHGENGNDKLYGGAGNDHLFTVFGSSELYGQDGDDTIDGYDGYDILDGGNGIDTLRYNRPDIKTRLDINLQTNKVIHIDKAYDIKYIYVSYQTTVKYFHLIAFTDTSIVDLKIPEYEFANPNSQFRQQYGNNFLISHTTIEAGGLIEFHVLENELNDPNAQFKQQYGNNYTLNHNKDYTKIFTPEDKIYNFENVIGGLYGDRIIGNNLNNTIYGLGGSDIIEGNDGDDIIYGEGAESINNNATYGINYEAQYESDTINGGNGNDTIYGGVGNDVIKGGRGNDIIYGGRDDDVIYGDKDQLTFQQIKGVQIDTQARGSTNDTYSKAVGDMNGDGFDDLIWMRSGLDGLHVVTSLSNGDGTFGQATDKQLDNAPRGSTNDTYSKAVGDMNGDGFDDLIWMRSGLDGLHVVTSLSNGDGTFEKAQETQLDTQARGDRNDTYSKAVGDINGDGLADLIWMYSGLGGLCAFTSLSNGDGKGNDEIYGGDGNDIIYDGNGNDTVDGGAGDDILKSGSGRDILIGGSGNDIFSFESLNSSGSANTDTILDFTLNEDKVDLSSTNISSFDSLNITNDGIDTMVADNNSNFMFKMSGVHLLSENDFVFSS